MPRRQERDLKTKQPEVPLTRHGYKDFTTSHEQIDRWWSRWPNANIGGCPAFVLDVDVRNGGPSALVELKGRRRLPETLTAETGGHLDGAPDSRGLHIYMTPPVLPTGTRWKSQLCTGVDIKLGSRGYVMLPPSAHPNGNIYRWITDLPPAPVPSWIVTVATVRPAEFQSRADRPTSSTGLVRTVQNAVNGSRHDALVWAVATAHDDEILTAELAAELADAARNIGLPDSEIEGVFRWKGANA